MPNMAPIQLLTRYAQDHRDPRNIALHCWGVPLVLVGLVMAARDFGQLGWAVAFTASGLLLQSMGHWYEGRRPRSGLMGWVVAPLFVAIQGLHRIGLTDALWQEVEQRAGPRRMRDLAL
jgi:uncharacterized membrane protein YGL010W